MESTTGGNLRNRGNFWLWLDLSLGGWLGHRLLDEIDWSGRLGDFIHQAFRWVTTFTMALFRLGLRLTRQPTVSLRCRRTETLAYFPIDVHGERI